MTYGHEVRAICRAHGRKLLGYCDAVFDPLTSDFRIEVEERFHCLGADLLVIDSILLARRWRGLKLGLLSLRKVVDSFAGGCGLVVCQPTPLEKSGEQGTLKLRRHIKRLGFRRIGRSAYYGLSTADITPKFEDLLQQQA
jgi:hypothetical protein